ncbi:penicillin acylase family protein [Frateuria aurantia]
MSSGLLLLAILALALVYMMLRGSLPQLQGQRTAAGLQAPVRVHRDRMGLVSIEGRSRDDVSFALGFVHAQERYFEMDLMRRLPAGELAELVGAAALPMDLDHRRHRLRHVAELAYRQLDGRQRHTLQRYADGVNAGLAALPVRPWAYLLLGQQPRPWAPEDSLLIIAAMYLDLNDNGDGHRELAIQTMRQSLPGPVVDWLLAASPDWEAPLQGPPSPAPVVPPSNVLDLRSAVVPPVQQASLALAPAEWPELPGSNSFAVAGQLSSSGAAIVANDMHLGLRVPNIWFRARLRYPDSTAPRGVRELNGVTLPGTPALVAGSNGQIAWGFTNSYGDWMDWVKLVTDPDHPGAYRSPTGWVPLQNVEETIRVKGQAARRLTVQESQWGPVLGRSDDGQPMVLAWVGDHPRGYSLDIMRLEQSPDTASALALASQMGLPPQNLLVGDRQGHIGWTVAGDSIPRRQGFDPQLPADWSTPGHGWVGWVAGTDYPLILDPADGRLWTANARTVSGAWLQALGNGGYDLGARAHQIRDDLAARQHFTPADLLAIQLDDRALFLRRWQHLLQQTLTQAPDPELSPALRQLQKLTASWHDQASPDSVDYRLVRGFRQQVLEHVLAPFLARIQARHPGFQWPKGDPEAAVWSALTQRPAWLLDPRYPDWEALLLASARDTAEPLARLPGGLAARRWGEIHHDQLRHALSPALPARIAHWLDMPERELAGDSNMPRVAAPAFGASERFDIMPGHEAESLLHMPSGQSDHPLSPYYGAGTEDWIQGRATPLLPGPDRYLLQLVPAS